MTKIESLKINLLNLYDNFSSLEKTKLTEFVPVTQAEANIIVDVLEIKLNKNELANSEQASDFILNLIIKTGFDSEAYNIYYQRILPIFKKLYPNLEQNGKNKLLRILAVMHIEDSLQMFVNFVIDPLCDDNFDIYKSIKAFTKVDVEYVDILFPALNKVFEFKDFRTVAVVEIANQLYSDKKLKNHPLENDLTIIEQWISNNDPSRFSYAVSGCASLSLINSQKSKQLLNLALKHSGLEVKLEAIFSQIILGIDGAKQKLEQFCLDSRISYLAVSYAIELDLWQQIYKKYRKTFLKDDEFIVMSQASDWLRNSPHYGHRPPSKIEIWDNRKVVWHNAQATKSYLFKYYYPNPEDFNDSILKGIGCVHLDKYDEYQVYSYGEIYTTPLEAYQDFGGQVKKGWLNIFK